jgi:hypothetical protein
MSSNPPPYDNKIKLSARDQLKERIKELETELNVTQNQLYDYERRFSDKQKIKNYTDKINTLRELLDKFRREYYCTFN